MTKSNTELLKSKIKRLREEFSDSDINGAMFDADKDIAKVGDLVRLRCGGPVMVVETLFAEIGLIYASEDGEVHRFTLEESAHPTLRPVQLDEEGYPR